MPNENSPQSAPPSSEDFILPESDRPKRIAKPGEEITPAPLDQKLDVRISIKRRIPLPALTSQGVASILSLEEYEQTYGANKDEIQKIADFAAGYGLKVDRSDEGQRAVWVSGEVGRFNKAFHTELKQLMRGPDLLFRFREGALSVPREMAEIIDSVDGLTNEPFAQTRIRARVAQPPAPGQGGFTPIEVASHYNFPVNANGAGQTIGVIELGGGFKQAELDRYFTGLGLQPIPRPVIVANLPGGGSNSPGVDFQSDREVLLDIEVIGAMAPGAQIVTYFSRDFSTQGLLDTVSAAIHDSVHRPTILSISWGGPEQKATQQYMKQFDQALQTAAQLGITVCVAAGDNGSADYVLNDPDWDHQAHVDFPASSPFALACGGTQITANSEVVWNTGPNNGTGGGISRFFPQPTYQSKAGIPKAKNPPGPALRGIPDVAGNASFASGYKILVNGVTFVSGGTSAVAPLWAALIARLNQSTNRRLGFLNPWLYSLSPASGALNDITVGNNGDYQAGKGWDACTGLGTPNGAKLLAALHSAPPTS